MSQANIDQRVTALEEQVARLSRLLPDGQQVQKHDWRKTAGMFADDAVMREIIDEGRKIRQRDRESPDE